MYVEQKTDPQGHSYDIAHLELVERDVAIDSLVSNRAMVEDNINS